MIGQFEDCYAKFKDGKLLLGNKRLERCYYFQDGKIIAGSLWDKRNQSCALLDSERPFVLPYGEFENLLIHCETEDANGLSSSSLGITVKMENDFATQIYHVEIFPDMPFVSTRFSVLRKTSHETEKSEKYDLIECVKLPTIHYNIKVMELFDKDDFCDTLIRIVEDSPYPNRYAGYRGDIFVVEPTGESQAVLIAKDSPVGTSHLNRPVHDLAVTSGEFEVYGSGVDFSNLPVNEEVEYYGVTVGIGDKEKLVTEYRRLLSLRKKGEGRLFVMANTWGDNNCEKALCEEFLKAELDAAADIGADVVQIDDGWEKGIITDPNRYMEHIFEGFHRASSEYWTVDLKRFPHGLEPIVEHAKKCGVRLGLWFSPDSYGDFENWETDVKILKDFQKKFGIRYFKLDAVMLRSKTGDRNFSAMVEELSQSGACLQLDVTAGDRFGYHYKVQYGVLFIENRYTDNDTYFPYRTLRNLWMLSQVIPSRFLQFEIANPRRNVERYGDDPFAPNRYDMDYLFASVMVANPLLWCELSHLEKVDAETLRKIICVWRSHSQALYQADVTPIGESPNGKSHTGFWACNGSDGYFVFLRENNDEAEYEYKIPTLAGKKLQIETLASNGESGIEQLGGAQNKIAVHFAKCNQYVFAKYKVVDPC
ncbi:alpha-galactosidase [Ruthenibacterium intestinale]|uniref:alpha-galactosidase n=1 Tax=Ruthenibacterium intestinale TaxID=3133163 RepID=UPI0032BF6964